MVRAADVLTALSQRDPGQLPRYRSERSGTVFARLTDPRNLRQFHEPALPVEARLGQTLVYAPAAGRVFKVYVAAFLKGAASDADMVELVGAQLRAAAVELALVDEFLPTIPADDPRREVRLDSARQVKEGMATVVAGALQTLTEREAYRSTERARLAGYLEDTLPDILPGLPATARSEAVVRLEGMTADPGLRDIQPEISRLLGVVRNTSGRAAGP